MSSDRPCVRLDTLRVSPCLCQTDGRQCNQGRTCPIRETEMASAVPLREELPKVTYSSKNYRTNSGAWLGQAPRTTEARWPSPPRAIEPGWFVRLVRRIFGR